MAERSWVNQFVKLVAGADPVSAPHFSHRDRLVELRFLLLEDRSSAQIVERLFPGGISNLVRQLFYGFPARNCAGIMQPAAMGLSVRRVKNHLRTYPRARCSVCSPKTERSASAISPRVA